MTVEGSNGQSRADEVLGVNGEGRTTSRHARRCHTAAVKIGRTPKMAFVRKPPLTLELLLLSPADAVATGRMRCLIRETILTEAFNKPRNAHASAYSSTARAILIDRRDDAGRRVNKGDVGGLRTSERGHESVERMPVADGGREGRGGRASAMRRRTEVGVG